MAQYTADYQLHQWESQDNFLRTDFSQDFAKIDAALASLKALTDGKVGMAALAAVETLANQKCRVVTGRYMGTGESYQIISLGFRPKVVVVDDLQSSSASAELEPDGQDARSVIVVDRGIQVENYNREINRRNGQYRYYAFV